ncbi:MAG TPA: portal protein [Candidatus Paceibacterota bacterium]
MSLVQEAESANRAQAVEDLRFRYGEQWPAEIQNSRQLESRPCLTINEVDTYCRQITNQIRQQRPRIKVHPVNDLADPKIAEVITGITRHIEVNSDADNAYDTGADLAVTIGWGYWRIITDYTSEQSFDQDIYIRPVDNPFSVYFDPNSVLPEGSDAEKCLISDMMPKKAFERDYPGAEVASFQQRGTGDQMADWVTQHDIRIAEYFEVDKKPSELVMLSDKSVLYADELPPIGLLQAYGMSVIGSRKSYKRIVKWCKVSAFETLEEKLWPGKYIPIVPVYGTQVVMDGKRKRFGLVRNSKDPQRMVNFWDTALTESIALAPKAKWLMAEGQDEGHENEWAQANIKALPVLRYKQRDINGEQAPQPLRLQPEPPPAGVIEAAMGAHSNLQRVMGIFDPSIGAPSGNKSGKALNAEAQQSDQSNFHYYDNLTRSIKHTGRIILDLIPKIYDAERVMRIIGDDGKPELVTINQQTQQVDEEGQAIERVLNDVTIGQYDVVMDTGPGYNSKRMEAVDAMSQMLQGNKELWMLAGDLIFRNMDFPGADVIADRLAAANPLAQVDEKSDIPPKVQMKMKQMENVIQQQGQALQQLQGELQSKMGLVQLQEEGQTKRALINAHTKVHDTDTRARTEEMRERIEDATWRHDIETRALTAQNVEELRGIVQLMLKHIDGKQVIEHADRVDEQLREKSDSTEPL